MSTNPDENPVDHIHIRIAPASALALRPPPAAPPTLAGLLRRQQEPAPPTAEDRHHQDILADTAFLAEHQLTNKQIHIAIAAWTNAHRYQQALVTGATRVDLDGRPAGVVIESEAQHAAIRLDHIIEQHRKQARKAAKAAQKQPPSPPPAKPAVKRSGALLRRVGRSLHQPRHAPSPCSASRAVAVASIRRKPRS